MASNASKTNRSNQSIISSILTRAREFGYPGDDPHEAINFIIDHILEDERHTLQLKTKAELDEVNHTHDAQLKALEARQQKKDTKIKELKNSLLKQSQQSLQKETTLKEQLREAEAREAELTDSLNTEKRLREELGRLGTGLTADRRLLSAKLTEKEMRFIDFIEKIMQQERQTAELHGKMRKAREEHLGSLNPES